MPPLGKAIQSDEDGRLKAITRFMRCFEELAKEIAKGSATWNDVRPWAREQVERMQAARRALGDWETGFRVIAVRPHRRL